MDCRVVGDAMHLAGGNVRVVDVESTIAIRDIGDLAAIPGPGVVLVELAGGVRDVPGIASIGVHHVDLKVFVASYVLQVGDEVAGGGPFGMSGALGPMR